MKLRILFISAALLLICVALAVAFNQQFRPGEKVYVKVASENLRETPGGNKLGTLDKAASVLVLEDSDKWVKVRVEGWLWKESLTASKLALQGEVYRAQQIVVKEMSTAEKALQRLKAGEDFAAVAKALSTGPAAQKGGDLGYFRKGDFLPEIESAILSLQPGEISSIVKSPAGYHIFKRTE